MTKNHYEIKVKIMRQIVIILTFYVMIMTSCGGNVLMYYLDTKDIKFIDIKHIWTHNVIRGVKLQ